MLSKLLSLSDEEKERGAITFSAGNAAQGLALAGRILGVATVVVMPETASPIKAAATRDYGARVVLHGTVADAYNRCMEMREQEGLVFVSCFDDDELIRGHASLGLEIIDDVGDLDAIVVGIGGGGLMSGIVLAREALASSARLLGVEPEGAATMTRSLEAGQPVKLERVATIADGLGAPFPGERGYELISRHVDRVFLVSDDEIAAAMRLLLERMKWMAEGAGAAPVASLLSGRLPLSPGSRVGCVVSGGNVDLGRLKQLL